MNLKDAILSTISEIENHEVPEKVVVNETAFKINEHAQPEPTPVVQQHSPIMEDQFLHDLRERILVLFEGFQSPNNAKIEAKVDLTLNFLEHLLAKIDTKLEQK